jgi:hypothetical protein
MTDMSARADDDVWRWVGSGIEVLEEFFFGQRVRIDSLKHTSFHTSHDFILTTIRNRQDNGHHCTFFGSIRSIEEGSADINW